MGEHSFEKFLREHGIGEDKELGVNGHINGHGQTNGQVNGRNVTNADSHARTAFKNEVLALSQAVEGSRNDQLNRSTFNLFQLVKAGRLDEHEVTTALYTISRTIGLSESETLNTIRSAAEAADARPIVDTPARATSGIEDAEVFDPDGSPKTSPEASPAANPAASSAQPGRRLVRRKASWDKPKRRKWLWDNMIPLGELTLWAGHAGIGKSQAAVWLASQVSRGELPGEMQGKPSTVLYVGTEDSWEYTILPRLIAAEADLDRVECVYAEQVNEEGEAERGFISMSVDIGQLRDAVVETDTKLIVIDALLDVIDTRDIGQQGMTRTRLSGLSRMAQDLQIVVVGVTHFRKEANGAPALHLISGSAEFGQVVRSAIGFAVDRDASDGTCVMAQMKKNLVPSGLPSIRYGIDEAFVDTDEGPTSVGCFRMIGNTDLTLEELLSSERKEVTKREECAKWLIDYIQGKGGGPIERSIVENAALQWGFTKSTIDRAREDAKIKSERVGFPAVAYWSLSDAPVA